MKTILIVLIILLWINLFIGNTFTNIALTLATTITLLKVYKDRGGKNK
ncbi:hypothetical protein [Staphylococcus xylosus]|nr:hypothetical protein [Staphylococcus xylosus]